MHDGSVVRFRRVAADYDPTQPRRGVCVRARATGARRGRDGAALHRRERGGHARRRRHDRATPLVDLPFEELCPGSGALAELMDEYR